LVNGARLALVFSPLAAPLAAPSAGAASGVGRLIHLSPAPSPPRQKIYTELAPRYF
jgi:hypothetical protein